MPTLKRKILKEKVVKEIPEFIFLTTYLTLFLTSLSIYRALALNEDVFSFFHLGYNFVEAMLLSKIILLGKIFQLGERFANRSLAIATLYKASIFTVFIFVFSALEHFITGIFKGHSLSVVWDEFSNTGINQVSGKVIIAFLFLILLFSFLELSRVIGEKKVYRLFFWRKPLEDKEM